MTKVKYTSQSSDNCFGLKYTYESKNNYLGGILGTRYVDVNHFHNYEKNI